MLNRQAANVALEEAVSQQLELAFERGIEHPFFDDVLDATLEALESPLGGIAQLDQFGEIVWAASRGFPPPEELTGQDDDSSEAWAEVLAGHQTRAVQRSGASTAGGPLAERGIATPILFGREPVGLLYAAGKLCDYDARDRVQLALIAKRVAPYLFGRSSELRFRRQLAELEDMANAAAEGERFFVLSGNLMVIMDEKIVRVNPAFWSQLGWHGQELRGRSLPDLAHPAECEAFARDLALLRDDPNRERPPIIVRMLAKDGQHHSIEWTGTATADGRIYCVGRDVSELHRAVVQLRDQNDQLRVLRAQEQAEQRLAGQLLANVRRQGCLDTAGIRHLTSPLNFFNGDVALAAPTPSGELRWMLGDFTGHGLSAAVGTIPIASAFYATSRKGVPLKESIETVNDLLKSLLPAGLFCAAAFLSLDPANRTLTVWNGGLPQVIVRAARDGSLRTVASQSLALGVVSSRELEVKPSELSVETSDEVFVYSDGLTETNSISGELFGSERVLTILSTTAAAHAGFDALVGELVRFRGDVHSADDVSLVAVMVGAVRLPEAELRPVAR